MSNSFRKKNLSKNKSEQSDVVSGVAKTDTVTVDNVKEELTANISPFVDDKLYNLIHSLLLVHNINTDNFLFTAFNEINKNNNLVKCLSENPNSIYNALLFAAEIGLFISEGIGDLFLVSDTIINQGVNQNIVKPMIGYKGFITLLYRGSIVKNLWAECVFEGDKFEYELGLNPKIIHVPSFESRNSNKITHVYAVVKLSNNETQFVLMSRKEVEQVRDMIKTKSVYYFNDKTDPNHWMVKKVAIKQLAKLLPKDYYTKKALEFDNGVEGGAYLDRDLSTNKLILIENKAAKKSSGKSNIYDFWNNK
jgi:recombination protein RecT